MSPLKMYADAWEKSILQENQEKQQETTENFADNSYHILLAHNPSYMEAYKEWGSDLILSGHLHGGCVRLPGIGGVITPQAFLFPKYSGRDDRGGRTDDHRQQRAWNAYI
mgnify:CR=1 FL=1